MVTDKDFNDSDWQTKCDFTASTTTALVESGYSSDYMEWYEFTSAATIVPFGSEEAYTQAPIDVILVVKDKYYRYFEIKGRDYDSTYWRFKAEGSFINKEKVDNFKLMKDGKIRFCYWKKDENGNYILNKYGKKIFDGDAIYDIPKGKICWGELYPDNKVRIWWDLVKIGLETLEPTEKEINIKKVTIDQKSEKVPQKRGYLQVKDATEIRRIRG